MVVPEHALEGTKEIAEYLGLSPAHVQSEIIPKMRQAGIIFSRLRGRIPHRSKRIYTFPSLIQKFLIQTQKNKYH